MKRKSDSIESLVTGGLIGAAIGAILADDKEEGAALGAILGAAFSATSSAYQEAVRAEVPVLVEENGNLYKVCGDRREFVKKIERVVIDQPRRFTLE